MEDVNQQESSGEADSESLWEAMYDWHAFIILLFTFSFKISFKNKFVQNFSVTRTSGPEGTMKLDSELTSRLFQKLQSPS